MPIGRALLYAEPIYLQAERSPMPELRIVVLALQDRLAYGPTFETAMAACLARPRRRLRLTPRRPRPFLAAARSAGERAGTADVNALVGSRRAGLVRLPAPDRRGQARRSGPEARGLKQKLDQLNGAGEEWRPESNACR